MSGAAAQTSAPKSRHNRKQADAAPGVSFVTSVNVVQDNGGPAVEILSTLPSVPSIQYLDAPPRLVIDLLHAQVNLKEKPGGISQENILDVRAEQFQADPPIARVVLDLKAPYSYTWDESGNRLMVRLKPAEDAAASKAHLRPRTGGSRQSSAASVIPTASANEVSLEENKIAPGSTLTSGVDTAVLHLSRGGQVRICPQSSVSVTPSKTNKDLMLGMNTGAIETHYALQSSADTVMTPDFRILFAGPGEFDFAVSTNARGDTCVRGLGGNGSSAIVSELMGDRIYQVKPAEQAVFRGGRIDKVDNKVPAECGCPPSVQVMRTETAPGSTTEPASNSTLTTGEAAPTSPQSQAGTPGNLAAGDKSLPPLSNGPEIQPLPPSDPNAVHVQVEAPMVFHAKDAASKPSDVTQTVPATRERVEPAPANSETTIAPPPPAPASAAQVPSSSQKPSGPRRMLRKIKGFFSSIFH